MTKDKNLKRTLSIRISTDGFCFCDYIPSQPNSLNYFFYKTEKSLSMAANLRVGIEENPLIKRENDYDVKCIEFVNSDDEYWWMLEDGTITENNPAGAPS